MTARQALSGSGRFRSRGWWPWGPLGALLFLVIFLFTLTLALPASVVLSLARSAVSPAGIELSASDARLAFPFALRLGGASVGPRGGDRLPVDAITAAWEPSGLWRLLPGHLRLEKGTGFVDMRTSPRFWRPSRGSLRIERVGSDDLVPLLSPGGKAKFRIEEGAMTWRSGQRTGTVSEGTLLLSRLLIPVPAPESPVREALLEDVTIRFVLRGGTAHISSLTGRYEGAKVQGTGEIAGFLTPSGSSVSFHLKIENPREGMIGDLFKGMAKNAKNANLRITGTLLSPTGEFQFF